MTDTRLAILPLTGAGEKTCEQCRWLRTDEDDGPWCQLYRGCPLEVETSPPQYDRLPRCLSAEREAARLRAVEGAARAYFAADDALAEKMQESEHWRDIDAESARAGEALLALRAAPKE